MLYTNLIENRGNIIMDKLAEGKRVFDVEIEALQKTRDALDGTYLQILDLITNCEFKSRCRYQPP